MKFKNPLIVVKDMDKSVDFYKRTLGLRVVCDFGANKTLTGGLALQTADSWVGFIYKNSDAITYGGNDAEIYFEEDDMDTFLKKLDALNDIEYLHKCVERPWGQRTVTFYDPDKHIIEVGENMDSVVMRFLRSGLSVNETAVRMDVPASYVSQIAAKFAK